MSMITEQIKRLKDEADLVECTHDYTAKLLREAADTIETLSEKVRAANMERSTAYYNGGWIPISEGLPKENKTVIASTKYGVYPEARYTKEDGWEWAYESGADYWKELEDVTAWTPLPKRYEPKERSDKE